MSSAYFFIWLGYIGLLLIFSLIFRKRVKSFNDFFFASRQLSASQIALSLAASWLGATSIIVTIDEASRYGLASLWLIGVPASLTVIIMAFILAKPVRRLEGFPLHNLLEARYGSAMRKLANIVIIWYLLMLASSQLVALASFLQLFLQKNYLFSLVLGLGVVIVYTSLGGLITVVRNDLFQGGFIMAGIFFLFFRLLIISFQGDDLSHLKVSSLPFLGFFSNFKSNGLVALSFTLAWLISPIAWQRVYAARDLVEARKGLLLTSLLFVFIYPLISFVGILGQPISDLQAGEQPLIAWLILKGPLTFWLRGLLFIAIIAAILSTLDTAINSCCLFLSREFIGKTFEGASARALLLGRLINGVVGFMAFFIASRLRDILQTIGLASEIMAEGLFIPVMAMFLFNQKYELAGLLSLILGTLFSFLNFLSGTEIIKMPLPSWPHSLPYGLALSSFGFVLGLIIAKLQGKEIK